MDVSLVAMLGPSSTRSRSRSSSSSFAPAVRDSTMRAEAVLNGDVAALDAIVDAFYGPDAGEVRRDAMRCDATRVGWMTKRPQTNTFWMMD